MVSKGKEGGFRRNSVGKINPSPPAQKNKAMQNAVDLQKGNAST
jgi:hypothetical protein